MEEEREVDVETGEIIEDGEIIDVDIDSDGRVLYDHDDPVEGDDVGHELAEYQRGFVMSPEESQKQAEMIRDATQSVLREGVDYGRVPGAGDKPVLLKPGAEWLLKWFGMNVELSDPEYDYQDDKKWGVTYRARVTKPMPLPDGRVITVAECDGFAGYDEGKFNPQNKDYTAPWNTVIKMAQKRAIVGATLVATGTSGLFTQDMDTYDEPNIVKSSSSQTGSYEGGMRNPEGPPTEKQMGFFHGLLEEYGIDDEVYRAAMQSGFGVDSIKDVTKKQASTLIEVLKDDERRERFKSAGLEALIEGEGDDEKEGEDDADDE